MSSVKNSSRFSDLFTRIETPLVCLGFVLSLLVFVFITSKESWLTGDSPRYLALADSLRQGYFGLFTERGFEPEGVRSFGYPTFILISQFLPGKSNASIIIVQGFLYLASIFFIWKLVKRNFGKEVSTIFLFLTAIYPFLAYNCSLISPECISVFLLALSAYILDSFCRRGHFYTGFVLTGFFLGVSVYFRSNLLALPFFITIFFLFFNKKNQKPILATALFAVLALLPATTYNYYYFNNLMPTPIYGGAATSLWMATWRAQVSTETFLKYSHQNEITPVLASSGIFEQVAETNRKIGIEENRFPFNMGYYPNNEIRSKVQTEYGKAAIENIKNAPFVYLQTCFMNVFRMWFSFHIPESIPFAQRFFLIFTGVLVFLAGLAGIIIAVKNPVYLTSPFVIFALGIILYHAITMCWLHVEARYTIPARLFLLSFASLAIFHIFELIKNVFKLKLIK